MDKGLDPSSLSPDELVARWLDWLALTKNEALSFYTTRRLLENVQAMFNSNDALKANGGDVGSWLGNVHVSHFLVCVRRELEQGGGHLTLINLLHELEGFSAVALTRARYVALYEDSTLKDPKWGNEHFDRKTGVVCPLPRTPPDADHISPAAIRRIREDLLKNAEKVLFYANWLILHRTSQKPSSVTWGDVYRVMDQIFDTYAWCYNLLTASVYVGRYPVPQYDLLAPFRFVWITDTFVEWEAPEE